jgi:sulfur-carrier protein
MSVTVRIPGPLRRITNGVDKIQVEANDLGTLIATLESQYPGRQERLLDENGELRYFVNLYLNNEDVRFLQGLKTSVKSGDEVSIVPAVAGGYWPTHARSESILTSPRDHDDQDLYDDPEELEELNRSPATSTFLEQRWWRWVAIAVAALVILAFTVPAVLPLLGMGNDRQPPAQGLQVPDFLLDSPNRGTVRLSEQLANNDYVVLVFYRTYHW